MSRLGRVLFGLGVLAPWASGCGESPCDGAAALQRALDAAVPGETVSIGACTIEGPITVPAGVRLEGAGRLGTVLRAGAGERAVTLVPSSDAMAPTSLADLAVESDGCAAVLSRGAGGVALERVDVRASVGVGVAVEGASAVTMADVTATGPIAEPDVDTTVPPLPPFTCGSADVATHGVVLVDVGSAVLTDVTASGFGAFGVLAVHSGLGMNGGGVGHGVGAGLEAWGGTLTLEGVELARVGTGLGAIESYGAVFGGGADVTSRRLVVREGASYGVLHDGAMAHHTDLVARDNGFAGVWAQRVSSLVVDGSASAVEDNGFSGVAVFDSTGVELREATVARTVERIGIYGARTVRAADGVHLVGTEATLDAIALTDNARVGVLVDLGGASTTTVGLTGLTVQAVGSSLGAIAQNGTIEAGWDTGITRLGTTAVNDAAFTGTLDIAEAVGPPCLPPLAGLDAGGFAPLVGL
jgi:hypothetical protein